MLIQAGGPGRSGTCSRAGRPAGNATCWVERSSSFARGLSGEELDEGTAEQLAGLDLGEVSDAGELDVARVRKRISDQAHRGWWHNDVELTCDHECGGGDLASILEKIEPIEHLGVHRPEQSPSSSEPRRAGRDMPSPQGLDGRRSEP